MATIRKTLNGTYNAQVRRKGKLYTSKSFKCRKRAIRWSKAQESNLSSQHLLFLDAGQACSHEELDRKAFYLGNVGPF